MVELTQPAGMTAAPLGAPKAKARRSSAVIVVTLALLLIAVIFAIFGFLCWQAFGTTANDAKTKSQNAANIVADDVQWALGGTFTALQLVANLGPAALDPASRPAIEAALKMLPSQMVLGLYDADGNAQGNSDASLPPSIATTDYFAQLKQGEDRVIPPLDTDPSRFRIAQRLGGTNFAGAAVVTIPMSLLETFWAPQRLGPDSTLVINREDGWMVGRFPPLPGPLDVSKTSAHWPAVSANDSGTYMTRSPLDGTNRVVGFKHIKDFGLVAFATISLDAAVNAVWNSIFIVLWLLVPIAVLLLVFALIIARILRQSEKTQDKLGAAVAHNEVLFREIHHRVKNNLQSVASLLQMQPIDRAIKANMGQRIAAMSAVHEHIYRSNNFSTVMVKTYLATLIENIRGGADPRVEVLEEIEDLAVDKDAATPLGLILNEVVSNAFKHAFPEGRGGTIKVQLVKGEDGKGLLTVEDDGAGFDPAVPAKGIGQRLIRALTDQLGGSSTMESAPGGGSRFTLNFPLAK